MKNVLKSRMPSLPFVTQTLCMNNIDQLIRSLRAWREHRPEWTPLLDKIDARLRQQAARAGVQLAIRGTVHEKIH